MKKSMLIFLILAVSTSSVLAEDYGIDEYGESTECMGIYVGQMQVVNCDNWVSLREWPNSASSRLRKVPRGSIVDECYVQENGYVYCEYGDVYGYIQEYYLSQELSSGLINDISETDGLGAFWRGSRQRFEEYLNEMDNNYYRVSNEVSYLTSSGSADVLLGYYMDTWLDWASKNTQYFSCFCDLALLTGEEYDFTDLSVNLRRSELYGWNGSDGAPEICDEYYIIRVAFPNGYWEDICVRMYMETNGGEEIEARIYGNAPRADK